MHSKNALSNLKNRYKSVLKKCNLINTFGTLAIASMLTMGAPHAFATTTTDNLPLSGTATSITAAGRAPTFENNGTITGGDSLPISPVPYHYGMLNSTVPTTINNGTITIHQSAIPNISGILVIPTIAENQSSTNNGHINIIGSNAGSGMTMNNAISPTTGNYTSTNNGTINLQMTLDPSSSASSSAMHILTIAPGKINITNTELLDVSASGTGNKNDGLSGMAFQAVAETSNEIVLQNIGTIKVNNTAENVRASGMYFQTISADSTVTVSNTGFINVSQSVINENNTAFEIMGIGRYNVTEWALNLRDWTEHDAVFAETQSINGGSDRFQMKFDSTHLILRPGTAEQGFVPGKDYYVADMVSEGTSDNSDVTFETATEIRGNIAKVSTEVDYLRAELNNAEPTNPSVKLVIVEGKLPAVDLANITLNTNLEHLQNVTQSVRESLLNVYKLANYNTSMLTADSGENTGFNAGSHDIEKKWSVFLTPYGAYTNNNKYDYDSDSYGVTGGANYNFNEALSFGFHLNLSATETDADALQNDSSSFAFGVHSHYFVNPQWYIGAQLTGAFTSNDIEYRIVNSVAKDTFDSAAFFATINTGYIFEINDKNIITPEVGLSYLYADMSSYNFHFDSPYDIYNMSMHATDYSNLYANLALTWQGEFNLSKGVLTPSVSAGIRQSLTDNDSDQRYEMFGLSDIATISADDTSFIAKGGIDWTYNDFTVGLSYNGDFGSERQSHRGNVQFIYRF